MPFRASPPRAYFAIPPVRLNITRHGFFRCCRRAGARDHLRRSRAHAVCELSRLGARRFRFLHPDFRHAGRRQGISSPHLAHRVYDHRDARAAPGRRAGLRLDRRPLRPPHPADDRRHLLLGRRSAERACSHLRMVPVHARALRNRDGRRMGRGRVARDGSGLAAAGADFSPACCRRVTRSAICSPRPPSFSSFRITAGARCSSSAARPRC